jgi:hypothetical protein
MQNSLLVSSSSGIRPREAWQKHQPGHVSDGVLFVPPKSTQKAAKGRTSSPFRNPLKERGYAGMCPLSIESSDVKSRSLRSIPRPFPSESGGGISGGNWFPPEEAPTRVARAFPQKCGASQRNEVKLVSARCRLRAATSNPSHYAVRRNPRPSSPVQTLVQNRIATQRSGCDSERRSPVASELSALAGIET